MVDSRGKFLTPASGKCTLTREAEQHSPMAQGIAPLYVANGVKGGTSARYIFGRFPCILLSKRSSLAPKYPS